VQKAHTQHKVKLISGGKLGRINVFTYKFDVLVFKGLFDKARFGDAVFIVAIRFISR